MIRYAVLVLVGAALAVGFAFKTAEPVAHAKAAVVRPDRAIISQQVRSGVSRRLHVLSGYGRWQTAARCHEVNVGRTRFSCAVWSQNLVRSQDFWTTLVTVKCAARLTACDWEAAQSFPVP